VYKLQMSILSGPEIREYVRSGRIRVNPFKGTNLNPASLDLTLGDQVTEYLIDGVIDVRKPPKVKHKQIDRDGFILHAHQTYLMHTAETLWTADTVPVVDGKSSLGRLFISVHQTAGYLDPGFEGQITLEVTSYHSVRVYAGMRFCQVRFHPIEGEIELYKGHYHNNMATGAVPSLVHQQMKELDEES
jgi:dCTP deaminase